MKLLVFMDNRSRIVTRTVIDDDDLKQNAAFKTLSNDGIKAILQISLRIPNKNYECEFDSSRLVSHLSSGQFTFLKTNTLGRFRHLLRNNCACNIVLSGRDCFADDFYYSLSRFSVPKFWHGCLFGISIKYLDHCCNNFAVICAS